MHKETNISVEQSDNDRRGAKLKLTRRGKTVLALTLSAGVLAGGVAVGTEVANAIHEANTPPALSGETIVKPGDTLWNLTKELAPDVDPRDGVDLILRANPELKSAGDLMPGMKINIPLDLVDNQTSE